MTNLRDYQRAAIDSIHQWFGNYDGNPLIVVPTGGGKSVICAEFIREVLALWPGERILVVTHVKELIEQNHKTLLRSWPAAPVGIYSAGLKRRDNEAQVLFAGIQSIYKRPQEIGHCDLILVDEAHLIPANGFGMYRTLLSGLQGINPQLRMIGLTATPFRTDTGRLDSGEDRMFGGVAYDCSVRQLIDDGWLSTITNRGVLAAIDTRGVHSRGGDFIEAELQAAATKGDLVQRSVKELVVRAKDRKHWLVFCCGVNHANEVAAELRSHGVDADTVFGETPSEQRDDVINRFRAKTLKCIVNVGVLTTGFDAPHVDLIALLRPTQSAGLYVQMVGRGMRKADGKDDCLILDFGGNVQRHGPIDAVQVREPGKGGTQEAPVRQCPECQTIIAIGFVICPSCGFEFPRMGPDHDERPDSSKPILTAASQFQRWSVHKMVCGLWANKDQSKPPTMRVYYACGYAEKISEWVCFDHPEGSFPRRKAEKWWKEHGGHEPYPETVDLALCRWECGEIKTPETLVVYTGGEFGEIKGKVFGAKPAREPGDEPKTELPPPPSNRVEVDYNDLPF